MDDVGDTRRLRFDLALSNLQSISAAQRFYLSALLVYLCLVWGWFFAGGGQAGQPVTVQLLGISLQTAGVWKITPLVTTFLSLALIGSITAAGPAWAELRNAFGDLGLQAPQCDPVFYNLDTHKNIFDYFSFLRLRPEGSSADAGDIDSLEQRKKRFNLRHFLYPALFLVSIYTTYRAVREPSAFAGIIHHRLFWLYRWGLLGMQIAYCVRPIYRAFCRFAGVRTKFVYD